MKVLYYFEYLGEGEQTIFVDEKAELVSYIHGNDGQFRPEYMNFIPEFFGGKMVSIHVDSVDDLDENDTESLVEELKPAILKAIKTSQTKKKKK